MWGDAMKKLFISQPMRGKTDEEIIKERKVLIADVYMKTHEEIEVIKSFSRAPRLTQRRCGIWAKASSCWAPLILWCSPLAGRTIADAALNMTRL